MSLIGQETDYWIVDPGTALVITDQEVMVDRRGLGNQGSGCAISMISYVDDTGVLQYFSRGNKLFKADVSEIETTETFKIRPVSSQSLINIVLDSVHYILSTPRRRNDGEGGIWVSSLTFNSDNTIDTLVTNHMQLEGDYSHLTAIAEGCCNKYIISFDHAAHGLKSFPINDKGIGSPILSEIGVFSSKDYWESQEGGIFFSKDLTQAFLSFADDTPGHLLYFNIETGVFTKNLEIAHTLDDQIILSASFSPNGKLLYILEHNKITNRKKIVQYDLDLPLDDVNRTELLLLKNETISAEFVNGVNDKTYFYSGQSTIGVIQDPNKKGVEAKIIEDISNFEFQGNFTYFGLGGCSPSLNKMIVSNRQEVLFYKQDTIMCAGWLGPSNKACYDSYIWSFNGLSNSDSELFVDVSGMYILSASLGTCVVLDTIVVTISPNSEYFINQTVCTGDTLQIGENNYAASGMYFDTLVNRLGCDSIIILDLEIEDELQVDTLKIVIEEGENYNIGLISFDSSGTYKVILENSYGCDSTIILQLMVRLERQSLYISNIFSPNNDGVNDHFIIDIPQEEDILITGFQVYDRYGSIQYTSQGDVKRISWNGNNQGNIELNSGVYVYVLKIQAMNGVERSRIGDVTLIR